MSTTETPPPRSALLSFTASNVRSYRDEVHFSMIATRLALEGVPHEVRTQSRRAPAQVLPAAGVFGANASGKSTLLLTLSDMRTIVTSSFREGIRSSGLKRRPFALDATYRSQPSRFEIELILDEVHWQYGFEVDDKRVVGEYAYHYPKGRQALVFDRTAEGVSFGPPFRSSGRPMLQLLRDNALLLSVAGATDHDQLGPLFRWFLGNLMLAEPSNRNVRSVFTADMASEPDTKELVVAIVRSADLGLCDIERVTVDPEVAERRRRAISVLMGEEGNPETSDIDIDLMFEDSVRLKHMGATGEVELEPQYESQGTMAWVGLIGPVLLALEQGHVLLADELDASLHPSLVEVLIQMFQDRELNPHCAQLIFNSHDTNVLGDSELSILGRDQIWFAEKDLEGASTVYSLADFTPRRDEAIGRRYLQGRFGAIPVVNYGEVRAALERVDP